MEYLRGYKVFFRDPDWGKKLLVASVLFLSTALVPVAGQIVMMGWLALMLRASVLGIDEPMPPLRFDFQYFGKLLGIGFKAFIAQLVWTLPLVVVMAVSVVAVAVGVTVLGAQVRGDEAAWVFLGACAVVGLIVVPVALVLSILANVAAMRVELTDDLNAGLRFGEVIRFTRSNSRSLVLGTVLLSLVGLLLAPLGLMCCYVGVFPVAVVVMVARTHLMAQIYQQHVQAGGEPLTIAPHDLDAQLASPGQDGSPGAWAPPPGG